MRAGIIAAGWGTRLGGAPKALTPVGGRALIDHVIDGLVDAGASSLTCIVNEASAAVVQHVTREWRSLDLDWIIRTTPSSMHSFVTVLERLAAGGSGGCLLTTVDSVCQPGTMREFSTVASALGAPLVLGVTDLVDDERPLYAVPRGPAATAEPFEIEALTSTPDASRFVTAGLYWADPVILSEGEPAIRAGFSALRQFLAAVVSAGYAAWGVPLPPVIDVDRPADVQAANRMVSSIRHVLDGY